MALQTTAVARYWLSSNDVGTPTDTNTTIAQLQRNGVFCAVHSEMLQAGQVSGQSQSVEWSKLADESEFVRGLLHQSLLAVAVRSW
jgi:hypothetical protein